MSASLGELAVRFGCELRGDPDIRIERVGTLDEEGAGILGFVVGADYLEELRKTRIAAVILPAKLAGDSPVPALVAENPHATFARVAAVLHAGPALVAGRHPTAVVHPQAEVDPSAQLGPHVTLGAGARIGARVYVGAASVIEGDVRIGDDTQLIARVTLLGDVTLGPRCILHPGVVVGSDGFGYAPDAGEWIKVPQVGGVRVGCDVEIGANTTIDRGALGHTLIADGVKLDNQVQVAHNVTIGEGSAIAACTGIAGSTRIGRRCRIGGGTGITGHVTIGDDVAISGFGMVTRSIDKPGFYTSVIPVEEAPLWRRIVARLKGIDALAKRVTSLERAAGVRGAAAVDTKIEGRDD